jgi:O-antigen ligase
MVIARWCGMTDGLMSMALLAAVGGLGVIVVMVLPRPTLLSIVIVVSAFATLGASAASGALLPSAGLLAAVALIAIFAAVLPGQATLSKRMLTALAICIAIIGIWTFVAMANFGIDFDLLGFSVQLLAYLACLVLAYRIGSERGPVIGSRLDFIVGLPAFFLIVGYALSWGPTVNATGRAVGAFSHANAAAAFLVVGVIACFSEYRRVGRKASLMVALLALMGLLLTQSLGGLGALAAGIVILFVCDSRIPFIQRVGLGATAISTVAVLFFWVGVGDTRLTELEGFDPSAAISTGTAYSSAEWRFMNWHALLTLWREEATSIGFGLGSTSYRIQPFGLPSHSVPVQILVELGLIGAAISVAIVLIYIGAVRDRYRTHPAIAAALAGLGVAVAVHASESNWLGYVPAVYLTCFVAGTVLGGSGSGRQGEVRGDLSAEASAT